MRPTHTALPVLGAALLGTVAGCYGNAPTVFPDGCGPFEDTNEATLPAAVPGDPCPEQLVMARQTWTDPDTGTRIPSVHARACIHVPLADVWPAIRDPQTGRDPTTTQDFTVVGYEVAPIYDFSYRTHVTVNTTLGITPIFDLEWRHCLVTGTLDAPTLVSGRWRKIDGTTAIALLEGSIVARPFDGDPSITEIQYQYHLNAQFSGYGTIEAYLGVIYGRLVERSHRRPLVPDNCTMCPTPPADYCPCFP